MTERVAWRQRTRRRDRMFLHATDCERRAWCWQGGSVLQGKGAAPPFSIVTILGRTLPPLSIIWLRPPRCRSEPPSQVVITGLSVACVSGKHNGADVAGSSRSEPILALQRTSIFVTHISVFFRCSKHFTKSSTFLSRLCTECVAATFVL